MKLYLKEVKKEIMTSTAFDIKQILRQENAYANSIATLAMEIGFELKRVIYVLCQLWPSIARKNDKNKNKQVLALRYTHVG